VISPSQRTDSRAGRHAQGVRQHGGLETGTGKRFPCLAAVPSTLDAKYWRDRAIEARLLAQRLEDPETRHVLAEIATRYDALARRAINVLVIPKRDARLAKQDRPP